MKRSVGIITGLFFCTAVMVISCITSGDDKEIGAPTVEANGSTIMVTSAPIKNDSFLADMDYANIFRRSTTKPLSSNSNVGDFDDSEWINIGQVRRPEGSTEPFTAFTFVDTYVATHSGTDFHFYEYKIRYHRAAGYIESEISSSVVNKSDTCAGEATLAVTDKHFLLYNRDDEDGSKKYDLTLYADSTSSIMPLCIPYATTAPFEALYVLLHNGSYSRPILLETISETVSSSTPTAEEYTVVFVANGGYNEADKKQYSVNASTNEKLPACMFKRDQYSFSGWNTKADGSGDAYDDEGTPPQETVSGKTVVLYAQWTENSDSSEAGTVYGTVIFDANNEMPTNRPVLQNYTIGDEQTLRTDCNFVYLGYEFQGWNTEKDGTGTPYADGDRYTFSSESDTTLLLYAQWSQQAVPEFAVECDGSVKIDLQKTLPTDFLDETLQPQTSDLVNAKIFSLIAMRKTEDTGFEKYYWTPVAPKYDAAKQSAYGLIPIYAVEKTYHSASDTRLEAGYDYGTDTSIKENTTATSSSATFDSDKETVTVIDAATHQEIKAKKTNSLLVPSNSQPVNIFDTTPNTNRIDTRSWIFALQDGTILDFSPSK